MATEAAGIDLSGDYGYEYATSALGGAGQGALSGFMVGGPAGALIGGITGLAVGLLDAAQMQERMEEAKRRQEELEAELAGIDVLADFMGAAGAATAKQRTDAKATSSQMGKRAGLVGGEGAQLEQDTLYDINLAAQGGIAQAIGPATQATTAMRQSVIQEHAFQQELANDAMSAPGPLDAFGQIAGLVTQLGAMGAFDNIGGGGGGTAAPDGLAPGPADTDPEGMQAVLDAAERARTKTAGSPAGGAPAAPQGAPAAPQGTPDGLYPMSQGTDPAMLAPGVGYTGDPMGTPGAELTGDPDAVKQFMEGQQNLNLEGLNMMTAEGQTYVTPSGVFRDGGPAVTPIDPSQTRTLYSGYPSSAGLSNPPNMPNPVDPALNNLAQNWVEQQALGPVLGQSYGVPQNYGPGSNLGIYNENYMKFRKGL